MNLIIIWFHVEDSFYTPHILNFWNYVKIQTSQIDEGSQRQQSSIRQKFRSNCHLKKKIVKYLKRNKYYKKWTRYWSKEPSNMKIWQGKIIPKIWRDRSPWRCPKANHLPQIIYLLTFYFLKYPSTLHRTLPFFLPPKKYGSCNYSHTLGLNDPTHSLPDSLNHSMGF